MGNPFHLKKKEKVEGRGEGKERRRKEVGKEGKKREVRKEEGREGRSLIRKYKVELLCLRQA